MPSAVRFLLEKGRAPTLEDLNTKAPELAKYSPSKAEKIYKAWIDEREQTGMIPSADADQKHMRTALNANIPRDRVRELRRKFAPDHWKKPGPRKKADNYGGKDLAAYLRD